MREIEKTLDRHKFLLYFCRNKKVNMKTEELALITENDLWSKIYIVRGVQVMLDFDLAAIYGYETRYFNRQVSNNLNRFDEDFRFQLTREEFANLMCKNFTSSWGGTRKLPYAFTEEGIYMLMTVLNGDLAVSQSKKLIRLFKKMKNFIIQNQNVLSGAELLKLSIQTLSNTEDIKQIKQQMVTHDELSVVMKDFTDPSIKKDYLFYNGQRSHFPLRRFFKRRWQTDHLHLTSRGCRAIPKRRLKFREKSCASAVTALTGELPEFTEEQAPPIRIWQKHS